MTHLVPLLVIVPLGVAFLIVAAANIPTGPGGSARAGRHLTTPLAWLAMGFNLVVSIIILGAHIEPIYVGNWSPQSILGIELVCDGLTKLMLITIIQDRVDRLPHSLRRAGVDELVTGALVLAYRDLLEPHPRGIEHLTVV